MCGLTVTHVLAFCRVRRLVFSLASMLLWSRCAFTLFCVLLVLRVVVCVRVLWSVAFRELWIHCYYYRVFFSRARLRVTCTGVPIRIKCYLRACMLIASRAVFVLFSSVPCFVCVCVFYCVAFSVFALHFVLRFLSCCGFFRVMCLSLCKCVVVVSCCGFPLLLRVVSFASYCLCASVVFCCMPRVVDYLVFLLRLLYSPRVFSPRARELWHV